MSIRSRPVSLLAEERYLGSLSTVTSKGPILCDVSIIQIAYLWKPFISLWLFSEAKVDGERILEPPVCGGLSAN